MSYLEQRRYEMLHGKPEPEKKVRKPINRESAKTKERKKKEREERGGEETDLVKWYKARMKEMSGYCAETRLKTETRFYQYAISSICHILDKRPTVCPSAATHPLNWIELEPSVHNKFDQSSWEEIMTWGCWPVIFEKLLIIAPTLPKNERRHVPDIVWRTL